MKKIIQKAAVLLLAIVLVTPFVNIKNVKAENVGTIKLSVDNTEVEKNGTVKVTVTVTSNTPLTVVNYSLKYDSKYFSCQGYAGIIMNQEFDAEENDGFTTASNTYTFTAIEANESGAAFELIVNDGDVITNDLQEAQLSITNATVKVVDHKASANANLSGIELSTGYLWPSFKPDHTVYAVGLDYDITSINIATPTEDKNAKVSFDASLLKDLKVGRTDVDITVTAENGTTKKYVLQVVRYEEETEQQTQEQTKEEETKAPDNQLKATVEGKEYTVVRDISTIKLPAGYDLSVAKYSGADIAVAQNDELGITLAYLIDGEANSEFFMYDEAKGTFAKYITVNSGDNMYVVFTPEEMPKDLISLKTEINETTITTWTDRNVAEIYYFYGMNSEGAKQWYSYDSKENTIQRAYAWGSDGNAVEGDGDEIPSETQSQTQDTSLKDANAEIARLNRELESLRSSSDSTGKMIIIVLLIIVCLLLIAGLVYMYLKYKAVSEEKEELIEESKELNKQVKEAMDLVAYTDEKFSKEKQEEKAKEEAEKRQKQETESAKSVNEDLLKNEINSALDKLSEVNLDDDDDLLDFLSVDDDDLFK